MQQDGSGKAKPKLLDQVRTILHRNHYSIRTEQAYVDWIIRFIHFHNMRHPKDMDTPEIEAFLNHLADQNVAASTQNQAFCATLFLYKRVLHKDLQARINATRAKKPQRLPTVLTRAEVWRIIDALSGTHQMIATLLYGSGMRLMECLRLRVKDLDFEQHYVIVRSGKDDKDRVTINAAPLRQALRQAQETSQDAAFDSNNVPLTTRLLSVRSYQANKLWETKQGLGP